MIIIGSNMGVQVMTKEHMASLLILKIPFFIVLTKIDIAPSNVYTETLENIKRLVKCPAVRRTPVVFDEKT
jgi:GTPase